MPNKIEYVLVSARMRKSEKEKLLKMLKKRGMMFSPLVNKLLRNWMKLETRRKV